MNETEIAALMTAISQRRSMGLSRIDPRPVPQSVIEQMLEAANWGQSNDDTEPWRFAVFTGDSRNRLADMYADAYSADLNGAESDPVAEQGYRDRAFLAPLWIAIGVEPNAEAVPEEELMAVATAVQNLTLVASAHGLAGMWHSKGVSVHPNVAQGLGWTGNRRLLGFFFGGYANCDWPEGERKPLSDKVDWKSDSSS
jgi:nitroreductase